jgi:hypothetical protein
VQAQALKHHHPLSSLFNLHLLPQLLSRINIGKVPAINPAKRKNIQPIPILSSPNCKTDTPIAPRLHLVILTDALAVEVLDG